MVAATLLLAALGLHLSPPAALHATCRHMPLKMAELPSSPKELAEDASLGVQAALSDGLRRLEVVCPDGLCFFGDQGKQMLGDPDFAVPAAMKERGDRELAYIVSEMFRPLGSGVACILPNDESLVLATREFAKGKLATRLVTSADELDDSDGGQQKGFGAKAAQTEKLRAVVVVRANKQRLAELDPIVSPLGDEVVVVLVNPTRLKSGGSRSGCTPAFLLRENPHPDWRGGLMYHRYPGQWLLGVAAAGGRPVIHGRTDRRPALEEVESGFSKIKDDTSLISQAGGVLSAAGAAAALERKVSPSEMLSGDDDGPTPPAAETPSGGDDGFKLPDLPKVELPKLPNPFGERGVCSATYAE